MPSDDPKIEEDFEDIDFDDVDADMDDESWDDFDDADVADDAGLDDEFSEDDAFADDDAGAAPAKGKKKKKGGSSFTLAVIGGAVIAGGAILYFTVFSGGSAPVPTLEPTAAEATDTMAETTPPLPTDAPVETTAAVPEEDSAFLDIEELSTDLPPMPATVEGVQDEIASSIDDIESLSTDDLDLGDLDFDEGTATPAEAEPMAESGESDVLTPMPDLDSMEDTELADLSFDDGQQQQEASMLEDMQAIEEMTEEADNVAQDLEDSMPELDSAMEELDAGTEDLAAMTAEEPPVEAAPSAEGSDQGELKALVNDLNEQLSAKDKSLDNATAENAALSKQLNTAESRITDLQSQIEELKNQLESASSVSDVATQPTKAPTKTTAKTTTSSSTTSSTASATPQPKKVAPKPKPVVWSMRSASPGNATLANQDGDLRRVEVGDTVPGLGRIESIAVQGGKWVVQGSKGSVSQ